MNIFLYLAKFNNQFASESLWLCICFYCYTGSTSSILRSCNVVLVLFENCQHTIPSGVCCVRNDEGFEHVDETQHNIHMQPAVELHRTNAR